MKTAVKITVLFFAVLSAVLPLRGDELDNYSRLLDRVENGFWRAAFSKVESTRNSYKNLLNSMRNCAKKINDLEYLHSVPQNSGDLTSNVTRISNLLDGNLAFRKKSFTFSGLKKSDLNSYRKKVAKDQGRSSQKRVIPYDELSLTDYKDFLNEIKDENLNIVEKRFRNARELNNSHREFLIQTATTFYTRIYELRATILLMRHKHPLFKPKK